MTPWSHGSVRSLLRGIRRPAKLQRDGIAREVERALHCTSAREAVLVLVERALRHEHQFCAEIVRRCDIDGETTLLVAAALHLSPRQFFRYRAQAVEAIAVELERLLTRTPARASNEIAARAVALGQLLLSRASPADVTSAMRHFERAVSIEPLCVEAYAGMAVGWLHLSHEMAVTAVHAHGKARSLAERALALDPRSAAAHSAYARVLIDVGLGHAAAAPHVAEALSLDPFDARGHIANYNLALFDGDVTAALRSANDAVAIEPTSFLYAACAMAATFYSRAYDDAIQQARELVGVDPRSRVVRVYLSDALVAAGRAEETIELLQPDDHLGDDPCEMASAAHARAIAGDREGAQRTLDGMVRIARTRHVSPYHLSYARLAVGDVHGALDDIEAGVRADPGWLMLLEHDPALVELYDEPRFRRLIALNPKV
ncbi:MAG: eukaryotic-like serine/threonine-protein kinase [Candidatus Eremiobacteraeota bacterium]|nr:eukaryotic-like serine/threonine-protein kinase [Candidatus Eremiobacteraeota bacterium]